MLQYFLVADRSGTEDPTPVLLECRSHFLGFRGDTMVGLDSKADVSSRGDSELESSEDALFTMMVLVLGEVSFGKVEFLDSISYILLGEFSGQITKGVAGCQGAVPKNSFAKIRVPFQGRVVTLRILAVKGSDGQHSVM